jgi:Zn-dependent protease
MILVSTYLIMSNATPFFPAFLTLALALVLGLLLAMTIHEAGHALVAYWLGDATAKRLGRLSLNPVRHLDVLGTAMIVTLGFGWAKPVLINLGNIRNGRLGLAAVAFAGPLFNLITVAVLCIPVRSGLVSNESTLLSDATFSGGWEHILAELLVIAIFFNLTLAVINLIPLFPLDGSKIVSSLAPFNVGRRLARLEVLGLLPLFVVLSLDYMAGTDLLRRGIIWATNNLGQIAIGNGFL